MKRLALFLAVALIASWTPLCSVAVSADNFIVPTIIFDDTALNDAVNVTVDNVGNILQDVVTTTGFHLQPSGSPYVTGGNLVEFGRVTFTYPGVDFGTGTHAGVLLEPALDSGNPVISDIFYWVTEGYTQGVTGIIEATHTDFDVFLESDYLGNSPVLIPGASVAGTITEEPGQVVTITFQNSVGTHLLGFQFSSDFNNPEPIPEPSTILLLGAGLAGVGLLRRRFKK